MSFLPRLGHFQFLFLSAKTHLIGYEAIPASPQRFRSLNTHHSTPLGTGRGTDTPARKGCRGEGIGAPFLRLLAERLHPDRTTLRVQKRAPAHAGEGRQQPWPTAPLLGVFSPPGALTASRGEQKGCSRCHSTHMHTPRTSVHVCKLHKWPFTACFSAECLLCEQ